MLARDLGMTVGELEVRMSWAELVEWMAFYQYEHERIQEAHMDASLRAQHAARVAKRR